MTAAMLKMFEPTMLPTAMSACLRAAATIAVTSSGSDVPTATMVRPISSVLAPSTPDRYVAESTIALPPTPSPTAPTATSPRFLRMSGPLPSSVSSPA